MYFFRGKVAKPSIDKKKQNITPARSLHNLQVDASLRNTKEKARIIHQTVSPFIMRSRHMGQEIAEHT